MKANEEPDKIYLTPLMLFAAPRISNNENDVEYTRTDAFIEKACEWLDRVRLDYYNENRDEFITNFKKHMKGE